MSWITVIWSMTAAACITLGLIHLVIWSRQRDAWANLLFALVALGTTAFAGFEIAMMRAATPAEFAFALRWIHLPTWIVVLAIAGFVRLYLKAGRKWLFWGICGTRTVALVLNFLLGQNINFWEVTGLRHVSFLGESVAIGVGVANHWMLVGQAAFLLLLIFVVDATITAWRRGDRRRAVVVGGGVIFFVLAASGEATLVLWQILPWPVIASLPALGTIAAMAYELTLDAQLAGQLSQALRESEERMTLAAEAANLGVWMRDLVRNEIWASNQWRLMFGFGKQEQIQFEDMLLKLHPEDRELFRRVHSQAINEGGGYELDYRVVSPDGGVRLIASRGRVECGHAGQPVRLLGVSQDITERRLAELALAQQRSEVAHLGRVTTLGEISGSLAHELNQPLGAILANTEAAELHLQNPNPNLEEVRAILADIRKDDERAGEIIHGMRAFLRRRELEMQRLPVDRLASEAVRLVSADAMARKVSIGLEIPATLPPVLGDRVHLQQVLVNLLVNAMDAMNQCPAPSRRITIRASQMDPAMVELAVSDAGSGIAPDDLDKVFEAFHTTKPGGLGLGLPICHSIIEAHGGTITIENNPDRGATVRVRVKVVVGGQ